jgi:hypothetical protein
LNVALPAELTKSTGRKRCIHLEESELWVAEHEFLEEGGGTAECVKRLATANTVL